MMSLACRWRWCRHSRQILFRAETQDTDRSRLDRPCKTTGRTLANMSEWSANHSAKEPTRNDDRKSQLLSTLRIKHKPFVQTWKQLSQILYNGINNNNRNNYYYLLKKIHVFFYSIIKSTITTKTQNDTGIFLSIWHHHLVLFWRLYLWNANVYKWISVPMVNMMVSASWILFAVIRGIRPISPGMTSE